MQWCRSELSFHSYMYQVYVAYISNKSRHLWLHFIYDHIYKERLKKLDEDLTLTNQTLSTRLRKPGALNKLDLCVSHHPQKKNMKGRFQFTVDCANIIKSDNM